MRSEKSRYNSIKGAIRTHRSTSPGPTPASLIAQALLTSHDKGQRTTPFERLLTAESKLQSLLSRALKDYRQLQKDRQYQDEQQDEEDPRQPFCPYATPNQTQDEIEDEEDCGAGVPPAIDDQEDCGAGVPPANDHEDDEQLTTNIEPTPAAQPNPPQPATRKNEQIEQIEPTCQNDSHPPKNPPNSFGGFPKEE